MEEGRFVEWLKHDGDAVVMGDLLYSVESDKSVNEVEATDDGILRIAATAPAPGTVIPVGALLGYITEPGEALPGAEAVGEGLLAAGESPPATSNQQPTTSSQSPAANGQPPAASAPASPTISPRARRIATELKVDWQTLQGSGRTGRIVERDVRAAVSTAAPTFVDASPVARRMAEEAGVDLVALSASLGGKRIDRADVEAAVAFAAAKAKQKPVAAPTPPTLQTPPIPSTPPTPAASRQPPAASPPLPTATRAKASAVRRITAERMLQSAQNTAPVTLFSEVDATQLVKLRNQLKASQTAFAVPSYTDLLAKICAFALQEHPTVNAQFEGDEIVTETAIHIGIAADTPRGLLVPVLRDVQVKTLRQIATESAALIARTREGKARADELQGSTFTITNLGMFDIDSFTPIINLPECAILGVGRIVPKQVVVNVAGRKVAGRKVAIRHMMQLSLTFDHRLVDGAPAARFLQRVQQLIQQPYVWLVS